ncbi:MAG: aconitate hydratase [Treponemataceae bacterium]
MGKNLVEKIIEAHLVSGIPEAGNEIGIKIDQTLTQDALGTMAYLQFESMGVPRVKTDSVSYVDHNTLQDGFENADDHRYLQTVADKHGIKYSKAGNGICHQVHLERFSRPGRTLIGSDSHTPTCGAVGMVAMGVGGLDVATAMAGGPYFFIYPKVVRVNLLGKLPVWSSAKDIILELLRMLTTKGNVGTAIEYAGPGVASLSVPERSTITNMGTELGVTTSIFPSDETTLAFFRAQGREGDWVALAPDADAKYDRTIDLDLVSIVPMVACPHSPDNVKTVREIAGLSVNQVLIGSCTNSSYRDLMVVAGMLKGKKVHPEVSFGITPGSKQVLSMIAANGALNDLISAGARILESTCGFCVGCGQAPQTNAVSVRTNNRNFEGRSGTRDAQVYLVSPETAAAVALTGKFIDPRDMGLPYPAYRAPDRYAIDDALVLSPSCKADVEVFRGPNIGPPPANTPMPASLFCKVAIKVGDKITTDHIMPAGSLLKYRSNIPKYAQFVFKDVEPDFAVKCKANAEAGFPSVIVAGQSYGQGSSREHAAMCPMYLGVRLLIAKSVERIHAANLVNFGILMLTFEDPIDYDRLKEGDELQIDTVREALRGEKIVVRNKTSGYSFNALCGLTERQKAIVLAGGALNYAAGNT